MKIAKMALDSLNQNLVICFGFLMATLILVFIAVGALSDKIKDLITRLKQDKKDV